MPVIDEWQCFCGEWTSESHWRMEPDGKMVHAPGTAWQSDAEIRKTLNGLPPQDFIGGENLEAARKEAE